MLTLLLAACATQPAAPVVDRSQGGDARPETYTVRRQDTLYSIAWRYNLEYEALARANGIARPYLIHPGQRIRLTEAAASPHPPPSQPPVAPSRKLPPPLESAPANASRPAGAAPVEPSGAPAPPSKPVARKPASPKPAAKPVADRSRAAVPRPAVAVAPGAWERPVAAAPVRGFSADSKGFDYALAPATRIRATAGGEVVYAGPGLGGFRHLVIVKASERYLVAYGVNVVPKLVEGDAVQTGDTVAEIGSGGADAGRFHFEIRDRGKPVDPAALIGD